MTKGFSSLWDKATMPYLRFMERRYGEEVGVAVVRHIVIVGLYLFTLTLCIFVAGATNLPWYSTAFFTHLYTFYMVYDFPIPEKPERKDIEHGESDA